MGIPTNVRQGKPHGWLSWEIGGGYGIITSRNTNEIEDFEYFGEHCKFNSA